MNLTTSIGFGGSNVHAILESYMPNEKTKTRVHSVLRDAESPQFTPFTFSAESEAALTALLKSYAEFLEHPEDSFCLSDFSWTLQYRRSQGRVRYAAVASTTEELAAKLRTAISQVSSAPGQEVYTRASPTAASRPRIAAIFTGKT